METTKQRDLRIPTRRARFLTREVTHAAGVSPNLFKSWILRSRGILALPRDERSACRHGLPISYSWNRVCQVALMEALGRLCWLPTIAAKAAVIFSDVGSDGADIPGCLAPDVPDRRPAELFDTGRTILAVRFGNDDSAEPITEIHQIDDSETFGAVWRRLTDGADGISLVDCAAVVERVKGRLDIE